MNSVCSSLKQLICFGFDKLHTRFVLWTRPLSTSLLPGTIVDLGRSKSELMVENALLRQQLIMLKRQVKHLACTKTDRILLVLLASAVRAWKQTLFLVQPDTLLRWHREFFRLYWKRRSKVSSHKPKVATETIALIKEMAKENQLWGCAGYLGHPFTKSIVFYEWISHGASTGKQTSSNAFSLSPHYRDFPHSNLARSFQDQEY